VTALPLFVCLMLLSSKAVHFRAKVTTERYCKKSHTESETTSQWFDELACPPSRKSSIIFQGVYKFNQTNF